MAQLRDKVTRRQTTPARDSRSERASGHQSLHELLVGDKTKLNGRSDSVLLVRGRTERPRVPTCRILSPPRSRLWRFLALYSFRDSSLFRIPRRLKLVTQRKALRSGAALSTELDPQSDRCEAKTHNQRFL